MIDRNEDTNDSRDAEISESLRRTASCLMKSGETEVVKGEDVVGDVIEALCLMHNIMRIWLSEVMKWSEQQGCFRVFTRLDDA